MKIFILISFMVFLLVPVSWACEGEACAESIGDSAAIAEVIETESLVIKSSETGVEHKFNVEMAATPETLMKGLMFRSSMPDDHGMLFLFEKEQARNFWMKNTYLPLDIIFIRESGAIHHIHENAVPLDETLVPSNGPVLNVLELNGGMTAKLGIKAGDIISLSVPSKSLAE